MLSPPARGFRMSTRTRPAISSSPPARGLRRDPSARGRHGEVVPAPRGGAPSVASLDEAAWSSPPARGGGAANAATGGRATGPPAARGATDAAVVGAMKWSRPRGGAPECSHLADDQGASVPARAGVLRRRSRRAPWSLSPARAGCSARWRAGGCRGGGGVVPARAGRLLRAGHHASSRGRPRPRGGAPHVGPASAARSSAAARGCSRIVTGSATSTLGSSPPARGCSPAVPAVLRRSVVPARARGSSAAAHFRDRAERGRPRPRGGDPMPPAPGWGGCRPRPRGGEPACPPAIRTAAVVPARAGLTLMADVQDGGPSSPPARG